jgi:pyruvate,water dikinase
MAASDVDFEPPGPGAWISLATHWTRPVTRFLAEIYPEPFSAGIARATLRYGLLVEGVDFALVNRVPYCSERSPRSLLKQGPQSKAEFEALVAQDEMLAQRTAAAADSLAFRFWREDLRRWDHDDKPQLLSRHQHLLAVDPSTLSSEALQAYIGQCRDHLRHAIFLHHRYTMPALLPIGDLMAHLEDWTGAPADAALRLLRGWSAASLDGSAELREAAAAVRTDPIARVVLDGNDPVKCVNELRRLPGPARAPLTAYLDRVAHRPVNGHDISEPTAAELPELLVRALREAVAGTSAPRPLDTEAMHADLRSQVPARHLDEFDILLAEARHVYRLRDERDLLNDGWAEGIARRAVVAAGQLLAAQGAVDRPADLIEAGFAEICALLARSGGPSAAELAARADYARSNSVADAPPILGSSPESIPFDWMPPAMARINRARQLSLGAIFQAPSQQTIGQGVVRGQGIGAGSYVGPARVVRGSHELGRLRPGDVLIAPTTTPAFNVALPLIGALATDLGGLLSHAAIVTREAGIPGVVGCGDATRRIRDGSTVRVDGVTGEVTPLT